MRSTAVCRKNDGGVQNYNCHYEKGANDLTSNVRFLILPELSSLSPEPALSLP